MEMHRFQTLVFEMQVMGRMPLSCSPSFIACHQACQLLKDSRVLQAGYSVPGIKSTGRVTS